MLPGYVELIVAYERHKDLLREAEQRRLINFLQHPEPIWQVKFEKVCHWPGKQLVKWGLKLQRYNLPLSSPVDIFTVTDAECS
jgi:hypothetical protein